MGDLNSGSITTGDNSTITIDGSLNTGNIDLAANGNIIMTTPGTTLMAADVSVAAGSTLKAADGTASPVQFTFNSISITSGSTVCGQSEAFFDDVLQIDLADCSSFILPIKLIFFNAQLKGDLVAFKWQTSIEKNNDFFEIEYSLDGKNFESLATEDGAGESRTILDYEYENTNPSPRSEVVYYRLKQTDFDGSTS